MTRRSTYELVDIDLHVPIIYYILQALPINHFMTNAIICNLQKLVSQNINCPGL